MATIEEIRKYRGIPFIKRGMKVIQGGKIGKIVGVNDSCNLKVIFEGKKGSFNCHPFWDIAYFAKDGSLIEDYRNSAPGDTIESDHIPDPGKLMG